MWGLAKMKMAKSTILFTLTFVITSPKQLDEDKNFNCLGIVWDSNIIKVLLSIYFPDDVVEAYNLIKDLEPTTPQVTYVPLDHGFDFSVIAKTVAWDILWTQNH